MPAAIAIMSHTGGATAYGLFGERYKSAATPQEEQRYLFNLGTFRIAACSSARSTSR